MKSISVIGNVSLTEEQAGHFIVAAFRRAFTSQPGLRAYTVYGANDGGTVRASFDAFDNGFAAALINYQNDTIATAFVDQSDL